MQIFSVKKTNDKGKKLSEKDRKRLVALGFKESKEGYYIDLQKLDTKYRLRKPHNKMVYAPQELQIA